MPITYVGSSAVATGANPNIASPAGLFPGDLLILITTGTTTPGISSFSYQPWNRIYAQGLNEFITIFYKFSTGQVDGGALLNTLTSTRSKSVILAYRGVGNIDVLGSAINATGLTVNTNTLTTNYANDFVLSIYSDSTGASTFTNPTGTTNRINSAPTASVLGLLIADELQAVAGLSTARTGTHSVSKSFSSIALALRENQTFYWVGGSGNWDAANLVSTSNWSISSGGTGNRPAPYGTDNIVFDSNSGSGIVTINSANAYVFGDITFTGYTGTLNTASVSHGNRYMYGNNIFANTMTLTGVPTGSWGGYYLAQTANKVIRTAGFTFGFMNFLGTGGRYSLQDNLFANTSTISLGRGTLDANNFNITTPGFSASGTPAPTVIMGNGTWTLTGTSPWSMQTTPTVAANNSTIVLTNSSPTPITFTGASKTYYNLAINGNTAANSQITFGSLENNRFNELSSNRTASWTLSLPAGGTTTINAWSISGSTTDNIVTMNSSSLISQSIISCASGTISTSNVSLNFITAQGGATFNALGARNLGSNPGWNFGNTYWVGGTSTWDNVSASKWSTNSGGPANAVFPANNNVFFDENSGSGTVTISTVTANANNLIFSGFSGTLSGTQTLNVAGNLVLSSSMTNSYTGNLTLNTTSSMFLTSNNINISNLIISSGNTAARITLQDNLNVTQNLTFNSGNVSLNDVQVNVKQFYSESGLSRRLNFGSSNINITSVETQNVIGLYNGTGFSFTTSSGDSSSVTENVGFKLIGDANSGITRTISLFTTTSPAPGIYISAGKVGSVISIPVSSFQINPKFLDFTGFLGTWAPSPSLGGSAGYTFRNNKGLLLDPNMNYVSSTEWYSFNPTTFPAAMRLTTQSRSVGQLTVVTGTVLLEENLNVRQAISLSQGTLAANGFNVSAGSYAATGVNGTVIMGNGTWTATANGTGNIWTFTQGFVFANNSTFVFAGTSPISNHTFAGGGRTYFNLNLNGTTGTELTITGANRFNELSSNSSNAYVVVLPSSTITTMNAWTANGSSVASNVTIRSSTVGTQATLNIASGTINVGYARIRDSLATGGATFTAPFGQNLGNNTGWNFGSIGRYWVGGSGTWDTITGTNWSRTSGGTGNEFPPIATDPVFFDGNSGSGTVTLSGALTSLSLNTTGSSFTFGGTGTSTISGNLTLSNTTVWNATGAITFNANTTVNTNGVVVNSANIILSTANTLTLSGNLTLGASNNFTHSNGTVNLNNSILTANSFNTSTANTRQIQFGTGSINLVGNGNTIWNGAVATGFSATGSSNVNFTYAGAVGTRTIVHGTTGGSITTANLNFDIVSGSDTVAITTASQMRDLDFTGFTGTFAPAAAYTLYGNLIASAAMTWTTGTGTITFAATSTGSTINTAGKSLYAVTFNGTGGEWSLQNAMTATNAMTLTSGRLNLNGFDASCLTFSSDTSNTRGVTFGNNNINITFVGTTGTTTVINMATMTGFSYTGTGGFKLTGASPAAVVRQTNLSGTAGGSAANAPNLWVSAGSDIISIPTSAWIGNLDFTGYTGTWSLPTGTTNIAGSFTVASGMTITPLTNSITFASTSTGRTINTAGKSLYAVTFNGVGGEWSLQNAMTATNAMTLTSGRLILNGFDATCLTFSGTGTTTRGITFGANNINITSTATGTVLDITNATGFTSSGTGAFRLSGAAASGITRTSVVGTTGGAVATAPNVFVSAGAAGSIFALTTSSWVQDLNFTGFSGTFAPAALTTITGNLIASAAMTWTTGTGTINFAATSTGDIITTAGKSLYATTFNGVGGGWTLQDNLTQTNNLTVTNGILSANDKNITATAITVNGGILNG
jgi:hypothetical protein